MTTYKINNTYLEKQINDLILDIAREQYFDTFWYDDFKYTIDDIIENNYNYITNYTYKMYSDTDFGIKTVEIDNEIAYDLLKDMIPIWLFNFMKKIKIPESLDFLEGYEQKVISNLLYNLESDVEELYDGIPIDTYIQTINELKKDNVFKGYNKLKKEVISALRLLEYKINTDIENFEYKVKDFINDTYNYAYSDEFSRDCFEEYGWVEIIK